MFLGGGTLCILQNNEQTRHFRGARWCKLVAFHPRFGGLGALGGFSTPKVPKRVDCIGLEQVERERMNLWLEV